MHTVVCLKQVPDSAQIRIHPVTNTIMRQGVPAIINPYDLVALEEALRLKDRLGGRITLLCMGPPQAEVALRKALSFGADSAILLTDKSFAGADTLATSYALAATIRKIHAENPVNLVFTGKQTIDGDTAQVGPGVAQRLGWSLLTYVSQLKNISLETQKIVVERRAEGGVQLLETNLPAVITVLEGINKIRFASMPDLFRAARADISIWSREQAGITDPKMVGLKGSATIVNRVFTPTPRAEKAEIINYSESSAPDQNPHQELASVLLEKILGHSPNVSALGAVVIKQVKNDEYLEKNF